MEGSIPPRCVPKLEQKVSAISDLGDRIERPTYGRTTAGVSNGAISAWFRPMVNGAATSAMSRYPCLQAYAKTNA